MGGHAALGCCALRPDAHGSRTSGCRGARRAECGCSSRRRGGRGRRRWSRCRRGWAGAGSRACPAGSNKAAQTRDSRVEVSDAGQAVGAVWQGSHNRRCVKGLLQQGEASLILGYMLCSHRALRQNLGRRNPAQLRPAPACLMRWLPDSRARISSCCASFMYGRRPWFDRHAASGV